MYIQSICLIDQKIGEKESKVSGLSHFSAQLTWGETGHKNSPEKEVMGFGGTGYQRSERLRTDPEGDWSRNEEYYNTSLKKMIFLHEHQGKVNQDALTKNKE